MSNVNDTKETTFGCGHTSFGACGQCLGRVTNERNDLLRKVEELEKANPTPWAYEQACKALLAAKCSLAEQGEELKEAQERLKRAEAVVEAARAMQRSPTWEVTAIEAERICAELGRYDAALAPRDSQIKENS